MSDALSIKDFIAPAATVIAAFVAGFFSIKHIKIEKAKENNKVQAKPEVIPKPAEVEPINVAESSSEDKPNSKTGVTLTTGPKSPGFVRVDGGSIEITYND